MRKASKAVYIALSGERAPSWPALRAAESRGHLSDAIHLRRLTREAVHIITQPNPPGKGRSRIQQVIPTL